MKTLKQIIKEEKAILRINEEEAQDMNTEDVGTVAQYLVDSLEGGDLNDTIAVKDFFIRNRITDPNKKKKILSAANKIFKGQ